MHIRPRSTNHNWPGESPERYVYDSRDKYRKLNYLLIASFLLVLIFKFPSILSLAESFKLSPVVSWIIAGVSMIIPLLILIYLFSYGAKAYLITFIITILSLPSAILNLKTMLSSPPFILFLFVIQIFLVFVMLFLSIFLLVKIHPDFFRNMRFFRLKKLRYS